jgi:AcrR family transcriptional regulator
MISSERAARHPRRRTQQERRRLSHDRMLDAAVALIAHQGSSRTTLSEIGERSGYTHGLVSHRFGSKGALVRALIQRLQADFMKSIEPALKGTKGFKALRLMCESYLRAAARQERLAMYALIGEALGPIPEIKPDLAKADENFRRGIESRIVEGVHSGELRAGIDVQAQSVLIVATLRGLVIQRQIDPSAFKLDAVIKDMIRNLERALEPAAGES